MIVIIDNYDSFTYNLYQYVGALGKNVTVFKNDQVSIHDLEQLPIEKIILSPGPGRPEDSGITLDVIQHFFEKVPILGVCLGHQAIGMAFESNIVHAKTLMHGKTSSIHYMKDKLFDTINNPFVAMRYHSLAIEKASLSERFNIIAVDGAGEIMAIKLKDYPVYGVQFHPESIGTKVGLKIIENFLSL